MDKFVGIKEGDVVYLKYDGLFDKGQYSGFFFKAIWLERLLGFDFSISCSLSKSGKSREPRIALKSKNVVRLQKLVGVEDGGRE